MQCDSDLAGISAGGDVPGAEESSGDLETDDKTEEFVSAVRDALAST